MIWQDLKDRAAAKYRTAGERIAKHAPSMPVMAAMVFACLFAGVGLIIALLSLYPLPGESVCRYRARIWLIVAGVVLFVVFGGLLAPWLRSRRG